MRLFVNPYSGKVMDLDQVPVGPGGTKFCPDSGMPLNAEAVEHYSYPGPKDDQANWKAEQLERVKAIEAQADEHNAVTLGLTDAMPTGPAPATPATPPAGAQG